MNQDKNITIPTVGCSLLSKIITSNLLFIWEKYIIAKKLLLKKFH